MSQEKIEFYKNRTIGERFSAAGDFVRQNWKVLLKNIAYVGVPLALLQGYFMQNYMQGVFSNINLTNPYNPYANLNLVAYMFTMLFSILLYLFLFSMTGAILNKYVKGSLTENTGWPDLKDKLFSFAGKLFLQGILLFLIILAISIVVAIVVAIVAFILSSFATGSFGGTGILIALLFILIFGAVFLFISFLSLLPFPIFFENTSAWQGIKKSFKLGFRYWGSTFLTILLGSLLAGVVSYILAMPYVLYSIFNMGSDGFIGHVLAMLTSLVIVIVYPVYIIFVGFQYTSIVEKEEGISLQEKVDEFDNL